MIFSSINARDEFNEYPEVIQKVIQYLRAHNFENMETGVYEIEGKDIYAQVFDAETEPLKDRKPESHKEYLDVQYLVSGEEKLGFTPLKDSYEIDEYIEDRDLIFYKTVENEGFIHSTPGCISIFFPYDVHRPQVAVHESVTVRKVVVKVRADLV